MLSLNTLIPFVRQGIGDTDPLNYEYPDNEIINNLQFCVKVIEGEWSQGYTVVLQDSNYYITPDPPEWLQMMYVLRTIIWMKRSKGNCSYSIPTIKITNSSYEDDLKELKQLYENIEYEHRYLGVEQISDTWDDFFSRIDRIIKAISEA